MPGIKSKYPSEAQGLEGNKREREVLDDEKQSDTMRVESWGRQERELARVFTERVDKKMIVRRINISLERDKSDDRLVDEVLGGLSGKVANKRRL